MQYTSIPGLFSRPASPWSPGIRGSNGWQPVTSLKYICATVCSLIGRTIWERCCCLLGSRAQAPSTVSEFGSHLRALWVRSQGWSCWEVETCYTYALLLHYLFTPPGGQQWGRNVFVEVCVNGGLLFQAHSGYSVCEGWCKAQRARGEHRRRCGSIVRQAGAQQGNNASYIATGGGEV